MTSALSLATALPENTGDGYVAAAYIVFFVILLIYVAIMALRLSHVQRDLRDLQARSSSEPTSPSARATTEHAAGRTRTAGQTDPGETVAGETVAGETVAGPSSEQVLEREPA